MIVFNLGCENSHQFEGWFASSDDYERQVKRRLVSCPLCGNANIARLPHAAHVKTGTRQKPARPESNPASQQYANVGRENLAKLVEHIIENTEDVGAAFPEEARKILDPIIEPEDISSAGGRLPDALARPAGALYLSRPRFSGPFSRYCKEQPCPPNSAAAVICSPVNP